MAILAVLFGLRQESDNHRNSGNLVHVARWRVLGCSLLRDQEPGDKRQGGGASGSYQRFRSAWSCHSFDGGAPSSQVGIS